MTDTNGNGQAPPMLEGIPILSQAAPWSWSVNKVGRDNDSGESVFLLRLRTPVGLIELWAPASFIRDLGEKLTAAGAGLHIANDPMPPNFA